MVETLADQSTGGKKYPKTGIIQFHKPGEDARALLLRQPVVEYKTVLDVITDGFAQQFKIFGSFCQHQDLPPFLICVQNILCDTPVTAGVVGKDAEDILNAGLQRNLWSRQILRPNLKPVFRTLKKITVLLDGYRYSLYGLALLFVDFFQNV